MAKTHASQVFDKIWLKKKEGKNNIFLHVTCVCMYSAPLPVGFSRQEYWSGLPCPPPGDLPHSGTKPTSPISPVFISMFFTPVPPREGKTKHLVTTRHFQLEWLNSPGSRHWDGGSLQRNCSLGNAAGMSTCERKVKEAGLGRGWTLNSCWKFDRRQHYKLLWGRGGP